MLASAAVAANMSVFIACSVSGGVCAAVIHVGMQAITFNANSNSSNIETVIQGFEFGTTSTTLGSRSVDFVFNDGDGTANGGDG